MSPTVAYGVCVVLGAALALLVRRREAARLGYTAHPGYRFVGAGCLVGAVVGAKLGMLFYLPLHDMPRLLAEAESLRFDGKTIVGALAGGYLFGELTKKLAGVQFSTGDALAVALPLGQAIGRVGCFFGGCCYGTPCSLPWAVYNHGALRHPVVLYEAALDLALAAALFAVRDRPRPPGHLFRYYLIGYGAIRFCLEALRGEPQRALGPLSFTQIFCLLAIVALLISFRVRVRVDVARASHQPATQGTELEAKRV